MKKNEKTGKLSIYKYSLLIMVLNLVLVGTIAAQGTKIGITAGVNAAGLTETGTGADNYNVYLIGFHGGLVVDFGISKDVSIIPELLYSQQGGGYSQKYTDGEISATVSLDYIKLPLNLAYKFKIGNSAKFFIFAGPYAGYAIKGQAKMEATQTSTGQKQTDTQDITFGSGDSDMKALDYGVNGGLGLQFGKGFFKLQYNMGLANLSNGDTTVNNKNLSLSIGYFF